MYTGGCTLLHAHHSARRSTFIIIMNSVA